MAKAGRFRVKFWGVRGSIPTPGKATTRFGGNTSCIEILGGSDRIVMDAGTGIRELGNELLQENKPVRVHLLLTHTHWDHIQGFPFFMPIYAPGNEIHVYGPRALEKSLRDALMFQMQYSYFPVRGVELQAKLEFHEIDEDKFRLGDVEITSKSMNHPIRVLGYKFRKGDKVGVYTGDNEPYYDVLDKPGSSSRWGTGIHRRAEFIRECNERVVDFCRGSDLLVADAQYTDEEYQSKRGWGHSSVGHVLELSAKAGVRKVVLFHHEPMHDDKDMEVIHRKAVRRGAKLNRRIKVVTAKEGDVVSV